MREVRGHSGGVLNTKPVQVKGSEIPRILGQPFLTTTNALINCR
jgi:hypothetical protein